MIFEDFISNWGDLGLFAVRGAILVLLAHLALNAMRPLSAAARERTGRAFCVALCLSPFLGLLDPGTLAPTPPVSAGLLTFGTVSPSGKDTFGLPLCDEAPPPLADFAKAGATTSAHPSHSAESRAGWVSWAWLAGTFLLLLRSVIGHTLAQRRLPGPLGRRLPQSLRAGLGIRDRQQVWLSDATAQPLVVGWLRPRIVLPTAFLDWPIARQRAALGHENAHILRNDAIGRWLWHLARALWWPIPGVHRLGRTLATAQEQACDDRALADGITPDDYATALIEIARDLRGANELPTTVLAMSSASQLEDRVRALLHPSTRRDAAPEWRWILPATAAFGCLLLLPQRIQTTEDAPVTSCRSQASSVLQHSFK